MTFEVPEPIVNSPFEEPTCHWYIRQGEPPELREGRRPSLVFQPRDQTTPWDVSGSVLSPIAEYERAEGYCGFLRYACKMATGAGKTTVMGMLAAWSILNKVNNRSDKRFSDVVLVVCPNVTIRDRLRELNPEEGKRVSTARAKR